MVLKKFMLKCGSAALCAGLLSLAPCLQGHAAQTRAGHGASDAMPGRFDKMDTNGDGKVVLEEFRAAFPNMNEKAFEVIDIDGNKSIERAEWFEFTEGHAKGDIPGARTSPRMNNIPGDPLIPPPDSNDLPLMRPPN